MARHWTDKELAEELKRITIICDSREQDRHVEAYLRVHDIPTVVRKLDTGDYSCQLGDTTFERDIVVERKRSLDEICGNFSTERERFEREFMRAKAYGTKVHLIIEGASWTDIFLGNYRSKLPSKSLVGSLLSWMVRFNISITFCKPEETARVIYGIFYYYVRERLLFG
ncbi:MAG: ERCC4 domain-containing protein [Bacteroidaceae bacterium]|nr:ERCC4 domain-containing protein [Bacteroidaceae bacterium]